MRIIPITGREWFGVLTLAPKLWTIIALPATVICVRRLSSLLLSDTMPALVLKLQKGLALPVLIGYFLICIVLVAAGIVEQRWQRRKQAIWDFVFAALALLCGLMMYGAQAVRVK